jgi:hypothetical protein
MPAVRIDRREGLVVGAAGALGAALLEQALGCGGFARIAALVTRPLDTAHGDFVALPFDGLDRPLARPYDTAWVVFDRERRANGREAPFHRPQPETLPALARWLHDGGVRRLLVVLPHAPGLLPAALRHGLASLDEQAVAALGFEQVVFMRSAQAGPVGAPQGWPHRVARWMLSQLRWMIATRDQAVRPDSVAAFAVQLALALPQARPGARVVPPELVWQAAQRGDVGALARDWLGVAVDASR